MKSFLLSLLLASVAFAQSRSFYTDRPDIFGSDISIGAGGTSAAPTRTANTAKSFTLSAPAYSASSGRGTFPAIYFTDDGTDRSLYLGRSTGGLTDFRVYSSTYGSPTSGNTAFSIASTGIARFEYAAVFVASPRPSADNTVDLGSSSFSWKDGWFDGDVNVGTGGKVQFQSRTRIESGSDGTLSFRTAAAGNMTRVLFGTANSSGQALSFSTSLISATDGVGTQIPFAALSYTIQDRTITHSTASPESAITAPSGSAHLAAISGVGSIWVKGSGTGNTGWLKTATVPDVDTLAYSGTDVTVTAGKGPLQQSQLTCTNDFTLRFTSLAARDSGTIYVAPAATNCTVTLPNYVFGLGARTLTITGGTGNTNYTKIAWEVDVIGGTNRVAVNAGNYF